MRRHFNKQSRQQFKYCDGPPPSWSSIRLEQWFPITAPGTPNPTQRGFKCSQKKGKSFHYFMLNIYFDSKFQEFSYNVIARCSWTFLRLGNTGSEVWLFHPRSTNCLIFLCINILNTTVTQLAWVIIICYNNSTVVLWILNEHGQDLNQEI